MKRFVVFHDYGAYEGWKIAAECDSLLEAVRAREEDLRSMGGGISLIFEAIETFRAYSVAEYEAKQESKLT